MSKAATLPARPAVETWRYKSQYARPVLTEAESIAVAEGRLRLLGPTGPIRRRLKGAEIERWRRALAENVLHAGPASSGEDLHALYWCWCEARNQPVVLVQAGRSSRGTVLLDMSTCLRDLSAEAVQVAREWWEGLARSGRTTGGSWSPSLVHIDGVPHGVADDLARDLWRIATGPATQEFDPTAGLTPGPMRPMAGPEGHLARLAVGALTMGALVGDTTMRIGEKTMQTRQPTVLFYKDGDHFSTVTTAVEADDFLRACAEELPFALAHHEGDEEFQLQYLLPHICDLWAKLRGYKAERVFEKRVLIAGEPNPPGYMTLMNPPRPVIDLEGRNRVDATADGTDDERT